MATPVFQAGQAALVGSAAAVAASAQVNQLLGTHADNVLYEGAPILTPTGFGGSLWGLQLATLDIDQPFTMSGTVLGRVAVPVLPVGNGADLLVSLCADSAGSPGTVLTQARIPASWISQLAAVSAVSGPSTAAPITQFTGGALAAAQFNGFIAGSTTVGAFAFPSGSDGSYINPMVCFNAPGYMVYAGGQSFSSGAVQQAVFSVPVSGAGVISAAVPQPSLPVPLLNTASIVQTDPTSGVETLFVTGGVSTTSSPTVLNSVYAAQFDGISGAVGSWSTQATLPNGLTFHTMATSGQYVYVIGGSTTWHPSLTAQSTVLVGQVSNGQVNTWTTTTPLSTATTYGGSGGAAVVGGFLCVLGGADASVNWYTKINADGTLGQWFTLPPGATLNPQSVISAMDSYGVQISATGTGNNTGFLAFTQNGPVTAWQIQQIQADAGLMTEAGADGMYQGYVLKATTATTWESLTYPIALTPLISVPLPTTGLTNGTTYHILLQQQGGDLNNYLRTHTDTNAFPGDPTALTSARTAYTWSALTPSGTCVPMQIYDQTITGTPLHTWEDSGVRLSTLVYATTPDQRLLGLADATRLNLALNSNQGFESGLSPWAVFNGTFVQSTTQVKEGLYAAKITPNGVSTQVFIQSELLACMPGQSITVSGWFWFTNSVTTNASLSVNWYTLGGTYSSTSSNAVSVPAATWTQLTNTFTVPSGIYQFAIVPTLGGTPAAGQIWYVDQAYATNPVVGQLSSVVEVTYPGVYPSGTFPPTGVVGLA